MGIHSSKNPRRRGKSPHHFKNSEPLGCPYVRMRHSTKIPSVTPKTKIKMNKSLTSRQFLNFKQKKECSKAGPKMMINLRLSRRCPGEPKTKHIKVLSNVQSTHHLGMFEEDS